MTLPNSNSVTSQSVDRATFENLYGGPAPWDIGRPQPNLVAIADRITSPVLDAGCGTGEHALFIASLGHRVVGIDFVPEAIRRARAKRPSGISPWNFWSRTSPSWTAGASGLPA